ncbi:6554_t:CDS:2 [Entrophospora sp. SA101]|nr:2907_t:CDS:2 [Entrophospora sp. SA101]CAJ0885528.1 6554_t:CDS:2 [Entrophospora sp. SA101]
MNIGCCHVALALVIIILPLVALLTNRTLKAEARVTKLEKKNGREQKQINELKLEKVKNSNGEKGLGSSNSSPLIFPSHQENNTPASSPPPQQSHGRNPNKPTPRTMLKQKPAPETISQAAEQALMEANQKIRELEAKNQSLNKTIQDLKNQVKNTKETKTFTCSDCQQTKPAPELSRQFNNFSFCRSCSKKARAVAQGQKPQLLTFTCASCEQIHPGTPSKMKLDKTLQEYPICPTCRPTLKEFNEADLITDEL